MIALVRAIEHAYRTMRLYPPGHTMAETPLTQLWTLAAESLGGCHVVTFETSELLDPSWAEEPGRRGGTRDQLCLLLYREGVKNLTLLPGLEREEMLSLVRCLSQAHDLAENGDDLVATLWEADLPHVDYEVVDPLLEAEVERSTLLELREEIYEQLQWVAAGDYERHDVRIAEKDWGLDLGAVQDGALLSAQTLEQIEQALSDDHDLVERFALVLTEVVVSSRSDQHAEEATEVLAALLRSWLDQAQHAPLLRLLQQLSRLRAEVPDRSALLDAALARLTGEEQLKKLVDRLILRGGKPPSEVDELLLLLGSRAARGLLAVLSASDDKRVRRHLLNLLGRPGAVPREVLEERLNDSRWFVVRNVALLLARQGDPACLPALQRLLHHPDPRVRREAVREYGLLAGSEDLAPVVVALSDPEPSVRVAAAHTLGCHGQGEHAASLLSHLRAEVGTVSEAESEAFLSALAHLADDRLLPELNALWEGGLLRHPPLHVRLGALGVLSAIGSPQALQSLTRASHCRNRAIRRRAGEHLDSQAKRLALPSSASVLP